ncbi:MAG: cupin domain-containing protein [Candidatus Bathyarchaeota archaeon]|nr:cupin domain-containing protein [Candidatus Bathyarchaeota archaeon]
MKKDFPKIIKDLPEADIEFEGVRGWIAQGENHQIVFFEMERLGEVSEHSHESPQWGIVVEGKMELTINNTTQVYERSDEYLIPARAKHSARFKTRVRVIDFFSEKARYKTRPAK